jgi:hypothetical protein
VRTITATTSTNGRSRTAPLFVALVAMAGCASFEDPRHRGADGWRLGKIVEIAARAGISRGVQVDWRTQAPASRIADRLFARVRYKYAGSMRTMIVPVPDASSLKRDDLAWIKAGDCNSPLEPYDGASWLWGRASDESSVNGARGRQRP